MQPITIIYEDTDILAINKPAGLIVHDDGKKIQPSVASWMLETCPESKKVGESMKAPVGGLMQTQTEDDVIEIQRPGIVHRLDRDTSGVLLLAKTQLGFETLKAQFQEHSIRKFYNAFVYGELKQDRGVIDRPIGRSKNDFRRWTAERGTRGELRDAVTGYTALEHGITPHDGQNFHVTFVEARPKTGRTHQIRVHFKAISHPVVADSLYAPQKPKLLGFERQALHAHILEFKNVAGKVIRVEAPYPEDFENALTLLRKS